MVEWAFGVLKKKWAIVRTPARSRSLKRITHLMYTCIILHNMIRKEKGKAISPDFYPEEQHREDDPVHHIRAIAINVSASYPEMKKLFEDAAKLFSSISKKELADERRRIIEQRVPSIFIAKFHLLYISFHLQVDWDWKTLESAPTVILKIRQSLERFLGHVVEQNGRIHDDLKFNEELTQDKDLPTPVHCFGHNVGFKRISLTRFRSCTSRSHYRSVSKQTTRISQVTYRKACLMLALEGFPSSL
ncbi:putative nuclease HARBI1 isoform X2 [Tanacetum coccineum]